MTKLYVYENESVYENVLWLIFITFLDWCTGKNTSKMIKNPNTEFSSFLLTNWDGWDLSVEVQHAVVVHIHQVIAPTLFIVTKEVDGTHILKK